MRSTKNLVHIWLDKADMVILVGEKQTKAILQGLNDKGFNAEEILVVYARLSEKPLTMSMPI